MQTKTLAGLARVAEKAAISDTIFRKENNQKTSTGCAHLKFRPSNVLADAG